jgi:hypothetical protein
VNVTLKPTLCPAGIVTGSVIPLIPNPAPVSESAVTVTLLPPVAVMVPGWGELDVPTGTLANVKVDGDIEICGAITEKFTAPELPPPGENPIP